MNNSMGSGILRYIRASKTFSKFRAVTKMASSYKTVHYILPLQSVSLYCSSLGAVV